MVVFTCNHCGDSLQKPKVEKHYQVACRSMKSLTCVDCFKDFKGEEYAVHTSCITEEERYSAKGSMPNGVIKKGAVKQQSWTEMIQSIIAIETNLIPAHRNLLNTLTSYNNVPRKKQKFLNFIKSASGGRVNMKDVEAIWNILEKHKNLTSKKNNAEETKEEKNTNNEHKRKAEENDCETSSLKKVKSENEENEVKFSYENTIMKIIQTKKTISLLKLQKKVLNAYMKHHGITEYTDKQVNKIHKKIKKNNNIQLDDDNVSLIT